MSDKLINLDNLSAFYDKLKSRDLANKADASSVYTKSEVSSLLDSYPKSQEVFTKQEVEDLLLKLEDKIYTRLGVIPDQPYPKGDK